MVADTSVIWHSDTDNRPRCTDGLHDGPSYRHERSGKTYLITHCSHCGLLQLFVAGIETCWARRAHRAVDLPQVLREFLVFEARREEREREERGERA